MSEDLKMESLDSNFNTQNSANVLFAENFFSSSSAEKLESADESHDEFSQAETEACSDGVCLLTWRPKRPDLAA